MISHPRFLCIHGHFYQPPRENPWLEDLEVEESAQPYHDWNERITMECYGPNTAARISTWDGRILDIRNNYTKISFNFGPTLLSWLEVHRPHIYEDIIEADRISVVKRSGHGNAIAQAYNHAILPLATAREKQIQVVWGLEDFRERFGRDPEGMWLPECGVDLETLETLAANGIRYTVLAPRQARRFRVLSGTQSWMSCDGGRIDPTRPYICSLPSGKSIVLFFYDGPISQAVAFEGLLNDGNHFAARLMSGYSPDRNWPQLLHIATDGESYGHHHRQGEMALAYALHVIERERWATLTNYGEYLSQFTPEAEVQIWNNSSWSCVHGVERWRSDCGCQTGRHGDWNQRWRSPLREAFRVLADKAEEVYQQTAPKFFADPERALLSYIRVLLNPKLEQFRLFVEAEGHGGLTEEQSLEALRLMEIMRNAQYLFTSCAWFFDEVSGLETIQNLKYAGRLLQLLRDYAPQLEPRFLSVLERAESNIPTIGNAREAYKRFVKPNVVDLQRVIAHHGIAHYNRQVEGFHRLFAYEIHERESVTKAFGNTRLKLCRVSALSMIDGETADRTVVVLHFGGHDFRCSMTAPLSHADYEELKEILFTTYHKHSLTELVRVVDEHFGRNYYSLHQLFTEGRRDLLHGITLDAFQRFDTSITMIFEENRRFMDYLLEMGAPLPQGFLSAAEFVLRGQLLAELDRFVDSGSTTGLLEVAREINRYRIRLVDPLVIRRVEEALELIFTKLALNPDTAVCLVAGALIEAIELLSLKLDHWEAQNIVFALVHGRPLPSHLARQPGRRPKPSEAASSELKQLAQRLRISTDPFEQRVSQALIPLPSRGSSTDLISQLTVR